MIYSRVPEDTPVDFLIMFSFAGFGIALLQAKVSVFSMTMLSVGAVCVGAVAGAFCPDMVWTSVAIGGIYGEY